MKISKIKFVALFLVCAATFMTASVLLGQPAEVILNTSSFIGILLSPLKLILMGPLLPIIHFLRQDPDTPPPFLLAAVLFYWALLALLIYFLINRLGHVKF